jgi:hypothetical protein
LLTGPCLEQAVELLQLGLEQSVQDAARSLSELRVAEALGVAGDALVGEVRIGVHRAEDRALSTWRAYCRSRTFWTSEPWLRRLGDRSRIEALPTVLAASLGRPST